MDKEGGTNHIVRHRKTFAGKEIPASVLEEAVKIKTIYFVNYFPTNFYTLMCRNVFGEVWNLQHFCSV
jgi:hypothetical protein